MNRDSDGSHRIAVARAFVDTIHGDRKRDDWTEGLWRDHLKEVSGMVESVGGDSCEIVSALLYASVRHGGVKLEDIGREFGDDVLKVVASITDSPGFKDFHALAGHVNKMCYRAKRITMAVMIAYLEEIVENPPPGWSVKEIVEYIEGMEKVAEQCLKMGMALSLSFMDAHDKALRKYNLR